MNSKVGGVLGERHVDRKQYEARLRDLLGMDDGYSTLVFGNHAVGKSDLIGKVLRNTPGVVHVTMSEHGKLAREKVIAKLSARDAGEVEAALRAAATKLGHPPIIILDVPRNQKDPSVMDSVSTFAKAWGYDYRLAKVLVVASSAAAALSFDPDGRSRELFIPPMTKKEMEDPQVDKFLNFYGGGNALKHKNDLFNLTGGNIGCMKELAKKLKTFKWEEVKQGDLEQQGVEVRAFFGIDNQGGFGPKEVKAASELAKAVAEASFEQCVKESIFTRRFTAKHFALAVRLQGAHAVYFNAAGRCYCSTSPTQHVLLKQMCIEDGLSNAVLTTDEKALITA